MKNQFIIALLLLAACKGAEKKPDVSVAGSYNMLSQHVTNTTMDTSLRAIQYKIYTDDGLMLYVQCHDVDSLSSWGMGDYTVAGDSVYESIRFSASDTSDSNGGTAALGITKTDKGYKQVIQYTDSAKTLLTEEYESIGDSTKKTGLDGMWKLSDYYEKKGSDSSNYFKTFVSAYKSYNAGVFAWAHEYADSSGKKSTAVGLGSFTVDGNKLHETMKASSYRNLSGQKFEADVIQNGNDSYTQVRPGADSTATVYEVYIRVKK
jgi:hypothetical protein